MAEIRRWRIEGRVQGVFFRASTQRQAEPLGLNGHAVNLPDGTVEVVAEGEMSSLDRLEAWLQQGPTAARVDRIERLPAPAAAIEPGFRTG